MTRLKIPATIEEATTKLNGLGALLTAKEWERAAIVRAFTRKVPLQERGRMGGLATAGREPDANGGSPVSIRGFAKLKIVGLRDEREVRRYHNAWESTGLPAPTPGKQVTLPTDPFPVFSPNQDKARWADTKHIVERLASDPKAMKALLRDKKAMEAFEEALSEEETRKGRRSGLRLSDPVPPPPSPDPDDEADEDDDISDDAPSPPRPPRWIDAMAALISAAIKLKEVCDRVEAFEFNEARGTETRAMVETIEDDVAELREWASGEPKKKPRRRSSHLKVAGSES